MVNTKHRYSTSYYPKSNSKVEHINGTITNGLRKTKVHARLGISPYELLYGLAPRQHRQDILQQVGEKLAMERAYYLMDRNIKDQDSGDQKSKPNVFVEPKFPVGSKVLLVNQSRKGKLDSKYRDKIYQVMVAFGNRTYILVGPNGKRLKRRMNEAQMRAYHERR
ncbi:hypothetical protein INT45_008652 [Circinella minor]|uniref:Uncharacterized protein n=1 Tax=Circinella minor TaxID=1195481 RepID=A0A8H7RX94_9FUNG|nr:hypothetical protein INT45_008652 [Circinella minor]